MPEVLREVLTAEAGQKWEERQEAIATYGRGSIVFLPKGVQPGERVHVVLEEIRPDSRGRMMYRGRPAPTETIERWEERQGNLELVELNVDWKLKETPVRTKERRAPAQREVPGSTAIKWQIVWGPSLADSYLVRTVEKIFVTEIEFVHEWKLSWKRQSERREADAGEMVLLKNVLSADPYWRPVGLPVIYPDATTVNLRVVFDDGEHETRMEQRETWGNIPQWFRDQLLVDYPTCSCNRSRVDLERPNDGYKKCPICFSEEACNRCGKEPEDQPLALKRVNGRFVCPSCAQMAELEPLAERVATPGRREAVAEAAGKLLLANALPRGVGQIVLESGLSHVTEAYARSRILAVSARFAWHYFASDGTVWGSRFAPEALEVLRYFDRARGDGLIHLTNWFVSDVYERTQVRGETVALDRYSLQQLEYAGGSAFELAKQLRGSEVDRQAAVDGYSRLHARLGEHASEVSSVRSILNGESQDYAAALVLIREAEEAHERALAAQRRKELFQVGLAGIVRRHYSTCPLCRATLEWADEDLARGSHISSEHSCLNMGKAELAREALVANWGEAEVSHDGRTAKILRRSTAGDDDHLEAPVAELVVYHKYGGWNLALRLYPDNFLNGKWETVDLWRCPSVPELKFFELEKLEATYPEQVADAERRFEGGDEQIKKLTFRRKCDDRTGQLEWVAGERADGVLYVVDRRYDQVIKKDGETHFCYIDRALVDKPAFNLFLVRPFLQVGRNVKKEAEAAKNEFLGQRATADQVDAFKARLAGRFKNKK